MWYVRIVIAALLYPDIMKQLHEKVLIEIKVIFCLHHHLSKPTDTQFVRRKSDGGGCFETFFQIVQEPSPFLPEEACGVAHSCIKITY